IHKQEHFKAFSPVLQTARGTMLRRSTMLYLKELMGERWSDQLVNFYNAEAAGARFQFENNTAVERMYNNFVFAVMMVNVASGLKQIASIPVYANYMDKKNPAAFTDGVLWALTNPQKLAKMYKDSPILRKRYAHGFNVEIFKAMHQAHTSVSAKAMKAWAQKYISPVKHGDMIAVLIGGGSVYINQYNGYIKAGLSKAEANKKAIIDMELATVRSQQTAEIFGVTQIQAGSLAGRIFSTFQSAQAAYFNIILNILNTWNISEKKTWDKIHDTMNMLLFVPLIYGMFASAFVPKDTWDDWLYDIIYWGSGNALILGNIFQGLAYTFRMGRVPQFTNMVPATQSIESLYKIPVGIMDVAQGNIEGLDTAAEGISPILGIPYQKAKNQIIGLSDFLHGNDMRFGRLIGLSEAHLNELENIYNK
ncbi:MAG: hypothetical protein Q8M92_07285, partial [Candidatus Subteraquimicrobiales bacterium]|nr:hypothetical protein [Candidatus Subteraquimicrobiales bacterium]